MTAPTMEKDTEIFSPEKKLGIAPGSLICQKICARFAPIARRRLI